MMILTGMNCGHLMGQLKERSLLEKLEMVYQVHIQQASWIFMTNLFFGLMMIRKEANLIFILKLPVTITSIILSNLVTGIAPKSGHVEEYQPQTIM